MALLIQKDGSLLLSTTTVRVPGYVLLALVSLWSICVSADVLTFDEIKRTDLQANFQPDCSRTQPPANQRQLPRVITSTNKFYLLFEPEDIQIGKFGKFFEYPFYIAVVGATPPVWYTCSTQVFTQGAFLDGTEQARFTVHVADQQDQGSIDLPIHSIAQRDFLEVTTSTTPARVDLSQASGVELQLRNLLSDTDLVLDPNVQLTPSHNNFWMTTGGCKLSDGMGKDTIRVRPGEPTIVRLLIEPRKVPALIATLTAVKPDSAHENINLTISYASDMGGVPRIKRTNMSIRFVPSLISLAIALLAGSLVGTLGAQLVPRTPWLGWYALGQKAARGLVFSVIADVFAMLLVALGSKFVILQFELDPWQFLPVFVIGIIVSGGKELLTTIGLQKEQPATNP